METSLVVKPIAGQGNGEETSEKGAQSLNRLNEKDTRDDQQLSSSQLPQSPSSSLTLSSSSLTAEQRYKKAILEFNSLFAKYESAKNELSETENMIIGLDWEIFEQICELDVLGENTNGKNDEMMDKDTTKQDEDDDATDRKELQKLLALERKWKLEAENELARLSESTQDEDDEPCRHIEVYKKNFTEWLEQQNISFEEKCNKLSKNMYAKLEERDKKDTALKSKGKGMKQNVQRSMQIQGPPTLRQVKTLATESASGINNFEPPNLRPRTLDGKVAKPVKTETR